MASSTTAAAPWRCAAHPAVPTRLRCDGCGVAYCRDCLSSRFITDRSAIWLCWRCARGGRMWPGPSVGRSLPRPVARIWWVVAAAGLLALASASGLGRLVGL